MVTAVHAHTKEFLFVSFPFMTSVEELDFLLHMMTEALVSLDFVIIEAVNTPCFHDRSNSFTLLEWSP